MYWGLKGDECASEVYGVILEKAYSRGEGRRTLSWIWYSDPISDTNDEGTEALIHDGEFTQPYSYVFF